MPTATLPPLRLAAQHITRHPAKSPSEVVRLMAGLQAQDYPAAKWAIGLRLPGWTESQVEEAVASKTLLRTWVMRGTLFFVAPDDARWMLRLTAERNIARSMARHKQLELDEATFKRSQQIFARALQGGRLLIRSELYDLLERSGISADVQRGYHMLWMAGVEEVICFGPLRGKQPTFALLDEWAPESKELERDEALAELALRYFTSRGPATIGDFIWWSGLAPAEARLGHELARSQLAERQVGEISYWHAPESQPASDPAPAHLIPGFDEYVIGYQDRSPVLDLHHVGQLVPWKNGIIQPTIALDGRLVGTWKRKPKKKVVEIEFHPFEKLASASKELLAAAADRYARYLDLSPEIKWGT